MQISEIKKIIKNSTAVLVLDEGEPSFVILDYKTYKRISSENGEEKEVKIKYGNSNGVDVDSYRNHEKETQILNRINNEILALKAQIEIEEGSSGSTGVD
jgi:PHD/YefM family antitoxin component YafN of YafNO toxin-antitoxin module